MAEVEIAVRLEALEMRGRLYFPASQACIIPIGHIDVGVLQRDLALAEVGRNVEVVILPEGAGQNRAHSVQVECAADVLVTAAAEEAAVGLDDSAQIEIVIVVG